MGVNFAHYEGWPYSLSALSHHLILQYVIGQWVSLKILIDFEE